MQPSEVARDKLTHSADFSGQFLMAHRQRERFSIRTRLGPLEQPGDQAVSHGAERKFFDNAHQSPQPAPDHLQNLQRHFRPLQAQRAEIPPRDEQQPRIGHSLGRRRVISAIKHRQLGDGMRRTFDRQHLLPSAPRALIDADAAAGNHVQAAARLAFGEQDLPGRIAS